ncbi:MAG TPA: DUF1674 domain-containing protein [Methylocella sp.]
MQPPKDGSATIEREGEARNRVLLSEAARRALAEAEERRRQAASAPVPKEVNGRDGPEPVRYGDWEVKGVATDF